MKNITLAIDDEVLADVRRYAAANNTTVNALVRSALEAVAERARRQETEWDELFRLADEAGAALGEATWRREDLHLGAPAAASGAVGGSPTSDVGGNHR